LNEKLEQYKVNDTSTRVTITKSNDVDTDGTEEIRRLLAQTNLKDQEMQGLQEKNHKFKQELTQVLAEKNKTNAKLQTSQNNLKKLNDKLKGRGPLLGAINAL